MADGDVIVEWPQDGTRVQIPSSSLPAAIKANYKIIGPVKPGFMQSLGRAVGVPTTPQEAIGMFGDKTGQMEGTPGASFNPTGGGVNLPGGLNPSSLIVNMLRNMGKSVSSGVRSGTGEITGALKNILAGQPIGANLGKAGSGYADILSTLNPVIAAGGQAGQQIAQGNLPGAAGSFTGGLMLAPMLRGGEAKAGGESLVKEPVAQAATASRQAASNVAPKLINTIIKPGVNDFSFGKNPGAGVAMEGLTANSAPDLLSKIAERKSQIGQEIESTLSRKPFASGTIDAKPIIEKPIDAAIKKAASNGEQELVTRLLDLKQGLTKEFSQPDAAGRIAPIADKNLILSPLDAAKLKRQIGDATRWTGQAFDNDINQVRVKLYAGLNDAIDAKVPGTKALNMRYGNMLAAEKTLGKALTMQQKNGIGGLTDYLTAGTGVALSHNPAVALAMLAAKRAAQSTAAKTRLARILYKGD